MEEPVKRIDRLGLCMFKRAGPHYQRMQESLTGLLECTTLEEMLQDPKPEMRIVHFG